MLETKTEVFMSSKQINPKLIQALTNEPLEQIPKFPTFKHLGGVYVKSIVDNIKKIKPQYPINEMTMRCGQCGKTGKYNVGIIAVSLENPKAKQLMGYFRCKHCNAGGPWEESSEIYLLLTSALLAPEIDLPVHFGELGLADGFRPPYATDGEEHYLQLINEDPKNGLLWNKLGNLYLSAGRPELAMVAFEKSIALDPKQFESHMSIANLLSKIKDYKNANFHYHQMMISAYQYPYLKPDHLRELLSRGICNSFIVATESKNKFNPLPSQEQLIATGITANFQADHLPQYLELSSEEISSFYPLAEAFMGSSTQELNRRPRKKSVSRTGTKAQQVEAFITAQKESFTKADIQQACPNVSMATITKVVRELRKAGVIKMTGTGINIRWFKI